MNWSQATTTTFRHWSNLTFDFDALRLDYLSIDFTSVNSQNYFIHSICLVVKRHEKDTLLYQRASKWSTHHLFTKNDTRRYTSENAQTKRLASTSIVVITVEAHTLSYIRMHCNEYRFFNQVIDLDQLYNWKLWSLPVAYTYINIMTSKSIKYTSLHKIVALLVLVFETICFGLSLKRNICCIHMLFKWNHVYKYLMFLDYYKM